MVTCTYQAGCGKGEASLFALSEDIFGQMKLGIPLTPADQGQRDTSAFGQQARCRYGTRPGEFMISTPMPARHPMRVRVDPLEYEQDRLACPDEQNIDTASERPSNGAVILIPAPMLLFPRRSGQNGALIDLSSDAEKAGAVPVNRAWNCYR